MTPANPKKELFLEKMAEHVLRHGLAGASLRPLAKAAGTSDRMLIYHFGSKDGLIAALLSFLAARLAQELETALPAGRAASRAECLTQVVAFLRRPDAAAFGHVWLEILAESNRGKTAFQDTGAKIIDGYLDWVKARLPEDDPDPDAGAATLLCLIEGTIVLDAAGRSNIASNAIATLR